MRREPAGRATLVCLCLLKFGICLMYRSSQHRKYTIQKSAPFDALSEIFNCRFELLPNGVGCFVTTL